MSSCELNIRSKVFGNRIVNVDEDDFEKFGVINWGLCKSNSGLSVRGWDNSVRPRIQVRLSRLIVNAEDGDMVYFKDGNGLNLTKSNLVVRYRQKFIEHPYFYKLLIYDKNEVEHTVLLDKQDYDKVKDYNWRITKNKNKFYVNVSQRGHRSMHSMLMGLDDDLIIDHKDGNPLNNRRSNLRMATYTQNAYNTKIKPNNTTGYKGVFYVKSRNRYWAYIKADKKRYSGGFFKTAVDAAKKYNEMAVKYHGEFANLNLIPHEDNY